VGARASGAECRSARSLAGRFSGAAESDAEALAGFLQLGAARLASLHARWARRDAHFRRHAARGVRVLRVEPAECLVAFICSANNNVRRVETMVERLCRAYGERLALLKVSFRSMFLWLHTLVFIVTD